MPAVGRRLLAGTAATAVVLAVAAAVTVAVLGLTVAGSSMRPTLSDGDRVVLNPLDGEPERFELVAVRFSDGGPLAVKRVVGLPGDRVRVDPAPAVLVQPGGDGEWLRVHNPAWRGRWDRATQPAETVVPAGELFVVGDNPDASEDSRARGPVPASRLAGTVWLRLSPPGTLGAGDVRLQPAEADG